MKKLLGLAVLVISITSYAQGVTTFGDVDCGAWINSPSAAKKLWLLGYLTGFNAASSSASSTHPKMRDALSKLASADQSYLWMDNYCRANPLQMVSGGAVDLYIELLKKN